MFLATQPAGFKLNKHNGVKDMRYHLEIGYNDRMKYIRKRSFMSCCFDCAQKQAKIICKKNNSKSYFFLGDDTAYYYHNKSWR